MCDLIKTHTSERAEKINSVISNEKNDVQLARKGGRRTGDEIAQLYILFRVDRDKM